jgi:hypothetical protein
VQQRTDLEALLAAAGAHESGPPVERQNPASSAEGSEGQLRILCVVIDDSSMQAV